MTTPLLSILIPATPARYHTHLWPLWQKLAAQVEGFQRDTVEILVFLDNRQRTIGEKRDALVQMSLGAYVAFCDDDDDVAVDYISSLLAGMKESGGFTPNGGPDVITFKQRAIVGGVEGICHFSLKHPNEPFSPAGFRRNAWHICAWRGDLARRYRFPATNYGEDWAWARHLVLEAKTEHHIDQVLHTYRYDSKVSEAPPPGATLRPEKAPLPEPAAITCYDDIPGWFDFAEFYDQVVKLAPQDGTFVELGTFLSKSTCYMMLKLRESGKNIRFDSYDNFTMTPGPEATDEHAIIAKHGSLEAAARACFTACTGLPSEKFLHNCDSAEAALQYQDGTVDFLFIDADHSEAGATRDIKSWLPKMRPGGIIAGHDIDFPDVKAAVSALLEPVRVVGRCWLHVVPR
jgi:hypothetical protein